MGETIRGSSPSPESNGILLWPSGTRTRCAVPGRRKDGALVYGMSWIVLVLSGMLEAVWATALGRSDGLTRLGPTLVFLGAMTLSMIGLGTAMRSIPIGTAYAVWVGIGASLTAGYAMVSGSEPVSMIRILLLLGIVGCVIGLKVVTP